MAVVNGTDKNDTITLAAVSSGVTGAPTDFEDIISGGLGKDVIDAGAGRDIVYGDVGSRDANDPPARFPEIDLVGKTKGGNDTISGGPGTNFLFGETDQSIRESARGGKDTINGGANNDQIFGDARFELGDSARGGNDILSGNAGDDLIVGDAYELLGSARAGNDSIDGGAGSDTIYGDAQTIGGTPTLGNDKIAGGDGNDIIYGDYEPSQFIAGLKGGKDTISGGAGDDWIYGGLGKDKITGGAGNDRIVVDEGSGKDTLSDFVKGEDVIEFRDLSLSFAVLDSNDDNVIGQGDDFVKASKKGITIDYGAAAGGDANLDVIVIKGTGELASQDVAFG
jgi:Ca2+-binding RTX toxin-like protein